MGCVSDEHGEGREKERAAKTKGSLPGPLLRLAARAGSDCMIVPKWLRAPELVAWTCTTTTKHRERAMGELGWSRRVSYIVSSAFVVVLAILLRFIPSTSPLGLRLRQLHQHFKGSSASSEMAALDEKKQPLFFKDQGIMFGDSITQFAWQPNGTGAGLADRYQRKLDLYNRGYSGYNTEWALNVAKCIFPLSQNIGVSQPEVRFLTVWFGANDAVLPHRPQCVPLPRFRQNLHTLISTVRSPSSPTYSPNTVVLMITPPPVDLALRAADCARRFPDWKPENMDREVERTRLYAEAVKDVAREAGLSFVDVWTVITEEAKQIPEGLSKYLVDGLHLTGFGYETVTRELMAVIERNHPDILPDALPHRFPWWAEIDPNDPSKSFPPPIAGYTF